MKQILLAVLCAGAIISCTKDKVVDSVKEVITFDSAFVDNATRAAYDGSYDTSNLTAFEVYATITNSESQTANIFNQELVEKYIADDQSVSWNYSAANTQYWVPNNTYTFRAIADGNVSGISEVVALEDDKYMATAINLLDATAQKDILVAEETVDYKSGAQTVNFTFKHILAKVKFTIRNTITTDNGYSYKVSDIVIKGVTKNGLYTFGGEWAAAATRETYDLQFGNATANGTKEGVAEPTDIHYNSSVESNYDRLLIPTSGELFNITFKYQLLKDGVVIDIQDKTIETGGLTLKPGHAYNFIVNLGNPGDPISFDVVKVTGWDTNHTGYNPGININ